MPQPACLMKNISKHFHGVPVLHNCNIVLYPGEIHAVIGDNGVGKSTLMKILAGYYAPDEGEIHLDGKKAAAYNRFQAMKHGITYVTPDSVCIPDMTVVDNMFLGNYPIHPKLRTLDETTATRRVEKALKLINFRADPSQRLGTFSIAERKIVLLASILCNNSKILILDEVALGLNEYEVSGFYEELTLLKKQGVSIFLVTQDLKKVFEIADQITMIANGAVQWSQRNTKKFYDEICQKISIVVEKKSFPKTPPKLGGEVLRVEGLVNATALKGVDMTLQKGEIVGVLGLAGAGRTSLARCLFGMDKTARGKIYLFGKQANISSPTAAMRHRIGFMHETVTDGIAEYLDCIQNVTLANIKGFSRFQWMNLRFEERSAAYFLERLRIPPSKWHRPVRELSRGEQQKILLAKWLYSGARILILDEPTIGMDVRSRLDSYNLMSELAHSGLSFLIISSDISELVGMCDRVYLMRNGLFQTELAGENLTGKALIKGLI